MNQVKWSEAELEKGSDAFLKAACSLPGRIINVNNGTASAGDINISIESELFQKLIKEGLITSCKSGYKVTALGVTFAD